MIVTTENFRKNMKTEQSREVQRNADLNLYFEKILMSY